MQDTGPGESQFSWGKVRRAFLTNFGIEFLRWGRVNETGGFSNARDNEVFALCRDEILKFC